MRRKIVIPVIAVTIVLVMIGSMLVSAPEAVVNDNVATQAGGSSLAHTGVSSSKTQSLTNDTSATSSTTSNHSTTTTTSTAMVYPKPDPRLVKANGYFLAAPAIMMEWNQTAFSSLVEHLINANVTYLYFNLPNMNSDASLQDNFSLDASLILRFDQASGRDHQFQFIAWTGTQNNPGAIIGNFTAYGINETVTSLYDVGFDGILLDLEPVPNDSPQFLSMLESFRTAINNSAPGMLLGANSMVVYPREPFGNEWGWDQAYFQNVTSLVNFVSPMLFESGMDNTSEYVSWVETQIQTTSQYSKCPIIYAIPDWYGSTIYHNPLGENISNAVIAFRTYLSSGHSPSPNMMIGLAIYGLDKTYVLVPGTAIQALETTQYDWNYFVNQWADSIYATEIGGSY